MITLKLYGEGCYIQLLASSQATVGIYNAIANEMNLPLEEALLDLGFYQKLNTDIHSVNELVIDSFGGLLPIFPSSIEVWFERKRVLKIPFIDLMTQLTLFPLYKIKYIDAPILEKGIYLKESVTGCIGIYKIASNTFNIDLLVFTILKSSFTAHPLLIDFTYNNSSFEKTKEDCLTRYQQIIVL
mgnify:CR=1 FL=1